MSTVKADDRVVRAGVGHDLPDDLAAARVHDMPMCFFERREINHFPVRGDRHAIASAFINVFPKSFFGDEVKADERPGRADVKPLGGRIRADAFDVQRLAFLVESRGRNALHETVAVVNVEHQHAVPAIFEVVANARFRHVQEFSFAFYFLS